MRFDKDGDFGGVVGTVHINISRWRGGAANYGADDYDEFKNISLIPLMLLVDM